MNAATPKGAEPTVQPEETKSPRQIQMEAMAERQDAEYRQDIETAMENDPGFAQTQNEIQKQVEDANAEAIAAGLLPQPEADGAASVQPMHEPAPDPNALPKNLEGDPLAEYIVMDNGQPMFQAKVNGQITLIPLAEARKQLQIGTAAEVRMQNAASQEQMLNTRENELRMKEAALAQRMQAATPVPAPQAADLDEDELLEEAKEIFNTAFTGSEEDAARKLAKTLTKMRGPVTPAQQIDESAIVRKAAEAAVTAMQNVSKDKDLREGWVQFQTAYPDIMADKALFKLADDMTDTIEKEHPEWNMAQVMDEAGTRTRAWVNRLKGVEPTSPEPAPELKAVEAPDIAQNHPNRQERKAGLVRLPTPAAGAIHTPPADAEDVPQSPQDAFAEIKAARGQPA
jgi:hypothetical protein